MTARVSLVLLAFVVGCGFPALPGLSGDASPGGDGQLDAPGDALSVVASPSSFVLHVNDTRETVLTVTNPTDQMSGTPSFTVSGLTLGTFTLSQNNCTTGLAKGASCTAKGTLTATTEGEVSFHVVATASGTSDGMVSLPTTVMPACPQNCGPSGNANCCASSVVPGNAVGATLAGATFYRGYDVATADSAYKDMTKPATVSDFRLDNYGVTVGRFRAFVNAGFGTQQRPPAAGTGAHAKIAGSGWDTNWNGNLSVDTNAFKTAVKCNSTNQTWTDAAGANEALPMNCITWFEAMAFCIWDGGYLPTEAEWHYAASGGSEHRAYPWSNPASSVTIDCSYANYGGSNFPTTACVNPGANGGGTNRVGSESPKGDGRWGHSDLAGNVYEWNLDWSSAYTTPCNDCANLTAASHRVIRGGAFYNGASNLRPGGSYRGAPAGRDDFIGVRCARTP